MGHISHRREPAWKQQQQQNLSSTLAMTRPHLSPWGQDVLQQQQARLETVESLQPGDKLELGDTTWAGMSPEGVTTPKLRKG